MTHAAYSALARALALSLALHAALFVAGIRLLELPPGTAPPAVAQLTVWLQEQFSAPAPQFILPQDTTPAAPEPRRAARTPKPSPDTQRTAPAAATIQVLSGAAARSASEQIAWELFYPPEAIERGLQGEALVLLFLDASGNAIAARLESSSGHALLDDAAVHAARTLRALPESAPREALLPVRFRLR